MHMLWECSVIGKFWTDVLSLIHRVYGLALPSQPKVCIMGLIGDIAGSMPRLLGIFHLLFQARKLLAFHLIQSSPSSISEYINRLNQIMQLVKGIYRKRNEIHKFEVIWGQWFPHPPLPRSSCSSVWRSIGSCGISWASLLPGSAVRPRLLSVPTFGAHSCTHSVLTSPCADWLSSIYYLAGQVSQCRW